MNFGQIISDRSHPHHRTFWMVVCIVFVAVVGIFDFLTGFELHFLAFYMLPIIVAVWRVGRWFGIFISTVCAVVSMIVDFQAGARYSSSFVPMWNLVIAWLSFFVVAWISARLHALHNQLEERVRQRTAALHDEMQRRMRLEEEILSISEREQQRIGRDLHDGLCQHLTGVALAGEVLSEQLSKKSLPEAKSIDHIVMMVEGAIDLTRTLARGLHPLEMKGEGFTDALRELAASVSEISGRRCLFEYDSVVEIEETTVATHLYRIAQEALNNAVKHSNATEIVISLETAEDGVVLEVCDNGTGIAPNKPPGMGLQTMAYRASVIGAAFKIAPGAKGGTCVTCKLPHGGFN